MPAVRGGGFHGLQVSRSIAGPLAASGALFALSVVLRTGVFDGVGEYSDIVHLYRRDGLAEHPLPYFDYSLEYPVLIGAFQWLMSLVGGGDEVYFAVSATALGALALATVWLLGRIPSANPWLLAAAPAIAFWSVQNWDFLALCPLVAALVLHRRRQDALGAAALALATWAKLFPLIALPVVVAVRVGQGRWRAAGTIVAVFAVVTLAVNAPVAVAEVDGWALSLRDSWTYFFEFSRDRAPVDTLWTEADLSVSTLNRTTAIGLAIGTAAIVALTVRMARRGHDVLVPATAAALLWLFAVNKVYSAQYALWIMLALALAALPVRLAAAFAAIDIAFFVTLWGGLPWLGELPGDARQVATAALAVYVGVRIAGSRSAGRRNGG